jgi:hypothetical protein
MEEEGKKGRYEHALLSLLSLLSLIKKILPNMYTKLKQCIPVLFPNRPYSTFLSYLIRNGEHTIRGEVLRQDYRPSS